MHIITNSGSNIKKEFVTLPCYDIDISESENKESEECDSVSLSTGQDELTFASCLPSIYTTVDCKGWNDKGWANCYSD